jgi:site-specific recombinase XerC
MRASKRTFPVQTRRLAILSFAAAGAFCSEISTLDFQDVSLTLASMKYVRVGRSAADERELLLGGDGLRAVNDYIGLRQDMSWVKDSALFVSHNFPFRRLSPAVISGQIGFAINETGLKGMAISPGALHRSAPGDALKAGFGGTGRRGARRVQIASLCEARGRLRVRDVRLDRAASSNEPSRPLI